MKKTMSRLLIPAFAMMILLLPRPAAGQAAVTVASVLSSCTTISVDVMVSNCPEMSYFSVYVEYDHTKLQYSSISNTSSSNIFTRNGYSTLAFTQALSPDTVVVEVSRTGTSTWNYGSGRLFTINFSKLQVGQSDVTIPVHGLFMNFNLLSSNVTNGSVTVGAGVDVKTFLSGPYSGGSMSIALRTSGLIPLTHPYSGSPWNYTGTESVLTIPANVVDWVLMELRTGTSSGTTVARRAVFLKNNGTIVDTNGSCVVSFPVASGAYYVVVRHRNHLAVMTPTAISLGLTPATHDFTTALSQAYGTNPMKDLGGGVFGLWSGDGNGNGFVTASDRNVVWFSQNGTFGYKTGDYNLTGGVTASDANLHWLPANGKASQVP